MSPVNPKVTPVILFSRGRSTDSFYALSSLLSPVSPVNPKGYTILFIYTYSQQYIYFYIYLFLLVTTGTISIYGLFPSFFRPQYRPQYRPRVPSNRHFNHAGFDSIEAGTDFKSPPLPILLGHYPAHIGKFFK